ncbi:MAG TPA: leucyl aminopeptidase [Pyrinomonadaceae bacterium]|nr:leucyl aminopeptidase [Pyrinomonadaceae bacterium]
MSEQHSFNIEIATETPPSLSPQEAIAVCVFEDGERAPSSRDDGLRGDCDALLRDGEFKGRAGTSQLFYRADAFGEGARRLLLIGLGAYSDFDANALRQAAGMAARAAREARVKHLYFILPIHGDERQATRAVAEGARLGLYDVDFYQKREEDEPRLERLTIVASQSVDGLRAEVSRAQTLAEAVNWARKLADEPGAALPPREFARRAAEMALEFGLRVETIEGDEVRERGMGGLWGVGKGSVELPALIVIRYEPENAAPTDELWAFVGKGITFDTGGISIKHGLDMYEMKTDMAGGAAVLGALRVIAQLRPPRPVIGVIPAAENMPSGRAVKPGDVIRTLAGYTIEVVDTDAEGRLVLADGIAYAKQAGARRIVDLATLTGSIIIALGDYRTGLFSNDDEWAGAVAEAARRAGEPVWRMPVSDDYKERIESPIADFKNYGGRPDATAAALLLSKFAAGTPWVHLDIAGTAWYDEAQPHAPKGSTGVGVRTLVELVCNQAGESP